MSVVKNNLFYKPKQTDHLNYLKDDIMLELNCHGIAVIQSFNATLQTAKASMAYQKVINQVNPQTGLNTPILMDYPPLVDCPVVFPFGSAGGFTTPPQQGDEVVVMFNDRDMDLWFAGQATQGPNTARLHFFTDAIILLGISSSIDSISNFDASRPVIRNFAGTSGVAVGAQKVDIFGNGTHLNALLQQLITDIQGITIIGGAVSPASIAALTADATAIGGLLA